MNNEEEAINKIKEIQSKIDREKTFLNGASVMRRQTNNDSVRSRLDVKIEESKKLIDFFEEKLREMQKKQDDYRAGRLGQGIENMSLSSGSTAGTSMQTLDLRADGEGPPPPPPKDAGGGWSGDRGSYGSIQYSQIGGHGDMMPPRRPYGPPGPSSSAHPRPTFTKLGLITQNIRVGTTPSLTPA
jgi:hypothetical protein